MTYKRLRKELKDLLSQYANFRGGAEDLICKVETILKEGGWEFIKSDSYYPDVKHKNTFKEFINYKEG